jgi:hypothetical protein
LILCKSTLSVTHLLSSLQALNANGCFFASLDLRNRCTRFFKKSFSLLDPNILASDICTFAHRMKTSIRHWVLAYLETSVRRLMPDGDDQVTQWQCALCLLWYAVDFMPDAASSGLCADCACHALYTTKARFSNIHTMLQACAVSSWEQYALRPDLTPLIPDGGSVAMLVFGVPDLMICILEYTGTLSSLMNCGIALGSALVPDSMKIQIKQRMVSLNAEVILYVLNLTLIY